MQPQLPPRSILMLTCADGLVLAGEAFPNGQSPLRSVEHFGLAIHGLDAEHTREALTFAESFWRAREYRLRGDAALEFGQALADSLVGSAYQEVAVFIADTREQRVAVIHVVDGRPGVVAGPARHERAEIYVGGQLLTDPLAGTRQLFVQYVQS